MSSGHRRYDSPARQQTSRLTRRRIIDAAREELLANGYHATTMAALARRAEVSPQTIYNTVGGKAALVKAVYDVLLAGDDAPIPMNDRPEIQEVLTRPTLAETLGAYARLSGVIAGRVLGLLGVVLAEGAGDDHELQEFVATIDRERRVGNSGVVRNISERFGLPDGMSEQRAVDQVWTLTAIEVADRLIRRCGWSLAQYERWLADQLLAGLAAPT